MIIKRGDLKTLLYQSIVQNPYLIQTLVDLTIIGDATGMPPYVYELGQDIPSLNVKFPAIRFNLLNESQKVGVCGRWEEPFSLFIESRDKNTTEIDLIVDALKTFYLKDVGRNLGIFSESDDYKDAIGASGNEKSFLVDEVILENVTQARMDSRNRDINSLSVEDIGGTIISMRFNLFIANYD